jgi:capsular exopolysaccharide synthesis family protein
MTSAELAVQQPAIEQPGVDAAVKPVANQAPLKAAVAPEPPHAVARIRRLPLVVASSEPLLPFENPQEHAAEQYRIARTKLAHHPKNPKMIVISSASSGDGKSFTAINLAGVLSLKGDTKVLLLDGDFRRSSMHSRLGLPASPGLAEVITGECAFDDAVVQADQFPNLFIMVRGNTKSINPSELLDSPGWHSLCKETREEFDYIIIDSPPVAAVADFELIQIAADGTILVVRPEHTKRTACLQAIDTIPRDKFLGVMLNCSENWFLSKHSSYGYGYGYTDNPTPARESKLA